MAMMVILTIQVTADVPLPLPAPTGSHSIAICTSGTLIGFGNNNSCQMGNGSTSGTVDPPVAASSLTNVVATSTGGGHSLALKDDGSVWVWGFNNQGQSAQSGTADVCTPTEVGSLGCAVAVSAGGAFSMALMADGTIYTWGSNSNGQLGSGSMSPSTRYTPAQVIGITNAIAISAGFNHAMALLDDGTVKVWGDGYYGQIGNSTSGSTASSNPTPISPTLTGIVRIEAGGSHNLALQNSGKLYVWGYNLKGQLGLGDYTDRTVPTSSSISSGTIVDMAAGINHTIILNSNGTLRVCGNSVKRELGICSGGTYNTGQNGPTISGIVDVQTSSSFDHNLAVTSSGALYTWGNNDAGQLGVGSGSAYECNPQHVNYSGSGVCSVKPSVDNQPQPCCVAVEDDDRTVIGTNGGTVTFTTSQTYTGLEMAIFGTIVLNGGTHYFNGCDVVMGKDAKIIVNYPGQLRIYNGSHFYACGDMWDGIEGNNRAQVRVYGNSIIEDAEIAVDVEDGAYYYIYQANFNRNYIHVRITDPVGTPYYAVQRIRQSKFLCQNSVADSTHANLLPPRQNEYTWTQIEAQNVRGLLVGSSGNGNILDHSVFGVVSSGVMDVEVLYNDFDDVGWFGTWAAYAPNVSGAQIDINYNTYDKSIYPIYCYDNDYRVRTHITNNTINFAGMTSPPALMTGITVEEITPASGNAMNDEYNYVDVSHNYIYNAPCGINLRNMLGNRLSPTAKLYVGDNVITHTKVNNDWQAGIKTDYVSEIAISNNIISHPSSNTNWWEASIRMSNGSHNSATCNYTYHHGSAIVTDNDIRPSSHFVLNEMTAHDNGFFMNYSIIGAQGTVAEPHDNQWLGSWPSGKDHIECYGSSSDGTQSPFTVRNTGSTYYPTYRTGAASGTPVPAPTTTANTWPYGCQYSGPSFKTDDTQEVDLSPAAEALSIIEGSGDALTDVEVAMNWNARFNLYRSLQYDEELLYSDDALQAFETEQGNDNIGKLYRAMSAVGRSGSLNEAAASELQSVDPHNRPEQTLKEVLEVLHASDLDQVSDNDEALLRDIAQRCPIDDGFGVYVARASLLKIDTLPKNYTSYCESIPSAEEIAEKQLLEAESGFRIYPNPAINLVTISYRLEEGELGDVSMFDALGNLVLSRALNPETTETNLQLSEISSGLYLVKMEVNGAMKYVGRFSVVQ